MPAPALAGAPGSRHGALGSGVMGVGVMGVMAHVTSEEAAGLVAHESCDEADSDGGGGGSAAGRWPGIGGGGSACDEPRGIGGGGWACDDPSAI